jgi:hypothetical protein
MIRFVLVSVLTFAFAVGWLPAAMSNSSFNASKIAQLPSISTPATPSQSEPPGVVRLGNIEVTPVTFDG